MGSVQSYLPLTALVVAGAAAYGYSQLKQSASPVTHASQPSSSSLAAPPAPSSKKQKQKKKVGSREPAKEETQVEPGVVPFPPVIPGGFDTQSSPTPVPAPSESASAADRAKPKKKKKGKKASSLVAADVQSDSSATAPESSTTRKPKKVAAATQHRQPQLDENGWTKVETKKKSGKDEGKGLTDVQMQNESVERVRLEISMSEVTTSVTTGNSSPVTERTEDESQLADSLVSENRRTLAERLLPKPRKTGVEDLLEEPDYPQLSRVMRIKPHPGEQPAAGFSWADYEDVDDSRGTANDADGEDDGGWGVVKSRGRAKAKKAPSQQAPNPQTSPEALTKKQRQHAARREAQKAAKADAEAERIATLTKHKRELEKMRTAEQAKSLKKTTSGGMSAYVDENGKLVWQ